MNEKLEKYLSLKWNSVIGKAFKKCKCSTFTSPDIKLDTIVYNDGMLFVYECSDCKVSIKEFASWITFNELDKI